MLRTWRNYLQNYHNLIFHENRLCLLLAGFYPAGEPPTKFEKWLPLILNCFAFITFFIPTVAYIFFGSSGLIESLEVACPFIACMLAVYKQILCGIRRERIRQLINQLQHEWEQNLKLESVECRKVLNYSRRICRRISLFFACFMGVISFAYIMIPITKHIYYGLVDNYPVGHELTLPYKVMLPIDLNDGNNYYIYYAIMLFDVYLYIMTVNSLDTLYIAIVCHVTSQFKLLNIQIGLMISTRDNLQSNFRKFVVRHNICIKLVQDVENIFNEYMFIQFLSSSLLICVVLFVGVSKFTFNVADFNEILYFFGAVGQLFVFCWISNGLTTQTNQIFESVYNLPWYTYSTSEQKIILLILVRGQKTLGITAAKFYHISYESFQRIMSTAGSYFALLQTIVD